MTPSQMSAAVGTTLEQPRTSAPADHAEDARSWKWVDGSPKVLVSALLFGTVFGFLLQKGGAATFDILIGVLLLENFVVVEIMLSAIIVGMVGSYFLRRAGVIERQIKETHYAANVVGGLTFGIGFGLLAYCPGTNAAALGQGNLDAIVGVFGLMAGSYAYALSTRYGIDRIKKFGRRGELTVPELVGVSPGMFIAMAAPLLIAVLVLLEWYGP